MEIQAQEAAARAQAEAAAAREAAEREKQLKMMLGVQGAQAAAAGPWGARASVAAKLKPGAGVGPAGPQKSLIEIQEEEARLAAQQKAAQKEKGVAAGGGGGHWAAMASQGQHGPSARGLGTLRPRLW